MVAAGMSHPSTNTHFLRFLSPGVLRYGLLMTAEQNSVLGVCCSPPRFTAHNTTSKPLNLPLLLEERSREDAKTVPVVKAELLSSANTYHCKY